MIIIRPLNYFVARKIRIQISIPHAFIEQVFTEYLLALGLEVQQWPRASGFVLVNLNLHHPAALKANVMPSGQRRQWHPTPVLLPWKSHEWRSLEAAVHGVAKSRTWLSDFTFTFHFHALEKEMATHSNVLAWRIPGTEEPDGLPSVGSHRVGYDWSNLAVAVAAYMQMIPPLWQKVKRN